MNRAAKLIEQFVKLCLLPVAGTIRQIHLTIGHSQVTSAFLYSSTALVIAWWGFEQPATPEEVPARFDAITAKADHTGLQLEVVKLTGATSLIVYYSSIDLGTPGDSPARGTVVVPFDEAALDNRWANLHVPASQFSSTAWQARRQLRLEFAQTFDGPGLSRGPRVSHTVTIPQAGE